VKDFFANFDTNHIDRRKSTVYLPQSKLVNNNDGSAELLEKEQEESDEVIRERNF
jgi:hypothetical protein